MTTTDYACYAKTDDRGEYSIYLQVEGMRCASCAWRIESTLNGMEGVSARINFSTERLKINWQGEAGRANELAKTVEGLGFHVAPFDIVQKNTQDREEQKFLFRCLAVSGFAAGNLMIFSLALWFSTDGAMQPSTRDMMHWVMALIALPTVIYAGRPFFYSAWGVLKQGHTNMDVPISLAIVLASVMSVHETIRHGEYVYFDASVMLIFFLLIGRWLDIKARGRAGEAAAGLLAMLEGTATIVQDGKLQSIVIRDITPGMRLQVASGEKIAADGAIIQGISEVDTSLVTGETLPRAVKEGDKVYAGMVNLSAPVQVQVSAASDQSLLADIVALMEKAEQGQAQYVRLADRVAALYTPVVHMLALATFIGWWWLMAAPWQEALLAATAVLIITCPCALGLAVPVVQVLASSRLFKKGMLLKSGNALEKLADIDTVVFDKTGTLTLGQPRLTNVSTIDSSALQLAASMAAQSRHPLAIAAAAAWEGDTLALEVTEVPAHGLEAAYNGHTVRLGKRDWCGNADAPADDRLEMWLNDGAHPPVRLTFADTLREDAAATVSALQRDGFRMLLLSGDRTAVAEAIAAEVGIGEARGGLSPVDKAEMIEAMLKSGQRVLMVGDGLNDAPALASASVSMSPSSAVDITQNAADIIFRGDSLAPVLTAIRTATQAQTLVKQNFGLSLAYNALAVPLAILGHVTPLIAAIAMSASSLLVIGNSFRLGRGRG